MSTKSDKLATASFAGAAGLLGVSHALPLPTDLVGLPEPIGLVLAFVGAAIKLFQFFKK